MLDIISIFNDFGIDYKTEGHKHCRPNWVNVECPFCEGNPGYHLGFDLEDQYFSCWRCGGHNINFTLKTLLKKPSSEIKRIIMRYGGATKSSSLSPLVKVGVKKLKFPSDTRELSVGQKRYIRKRGFDPDEMIRDWGILGTGPVSVLDGINYKNRILIPIHWEGELVSFLTRSTSKDAMFRYIACPMEREVINHKKLLYLSENLKSNVAICVEGVFDVWKLGLQYTFGLFGIKYTLEQVRLISSRFQRVYILFDSDIQAQIQARKLCAELRFRGIYCDVLPPPKTDPADMTDNEVASLLSQIKLI